MQKRQNNVACCYGPRCTCVEISKAVDMYMFLFDDILLLTRVKKPPRKARIDTFVTGLSVCLSTPIRERTSAGIVSTHVQISAEAENTFRGASHLPRVDVVTISSVFCSFFLCSVALASL